MTELILHMNNYSIIHSQKKKKLFHYRNYYSIPNIALRSFLDGRGGLGPYSSVPFEFSFGYVLIILNFKMFHLNF